MLDHFEVADLFLERGWLTPDRVVEGDVEISGASRRNRNFKVASEHGPSYFLKQAVGAEKAATIAREAAFYALLSRDPSAEPFARYLPRFYDYDPQLGTLLLELLPGAATFTQYHLRLGRFPVGPARSLGRALSALHHVDVTSATGEALDWTAWPPAPPPWALWVHRPLLASMHEASAANLQMVRIIQQVTEFGRLLDDLLTGWTASALTHSDIKWDNLLLYPHRSTSRIGRRPIEVEARKESQRESRAPGRLVTRLKIVDWEMACIGDPGWDVGSVFGGYLSFWLNSIPLTGEGSPERLLSLARYPLHRMHRALRAFWSAYARGLCLEPEEANRRLLQGVRYAAARLVQSAYEDSRPAPELTGNLLCFLQVSLNMLLRPAGAAQHLLGIPSAQTAGTG